MRVLEFRVTGLGFRVWGRVEGSGLRVMMMCIPDLLNRIHRVLRAKNDLRSLHVSVYLRGSVCAVSHSW